MGNVNENCCKSPGDMVSILRSQQPLKAASRTLTSHSRPICRSCSRRSTPIDQRRTISSYGYEQAKALVYSEPAAVAGNEGVAEVISTGSGVKTLSKGDWVIMKSTGMGTWRTHMAIDESKLLKIDDKEGLTPLQ